MNEGYIKTYRQILDWEWWHDINTFRVFIYLLLKANWKEGKFKGIIVPIGSLVTSVPRIAVDTDLTENEVRTALKHLEMTNEINRQTTSKFSLISLNNYELYQSEAQTNHSQSTDKSQSINSQLTTIEERKNIKKEIKEEYIPPIIPQKGKKKTAVATKEELEELLNETAFSDSLKNGIRGWLDYKSEKRQGYKPIGFKQLLTKITNQLSIESEIDIENDIEECMSRNYAGIYFGTAKKVAAKGQQTTEDWKKMWEEA